MSATTVAPSRGATAVTADDADALLAGARAGDPLAREELVARHLDGVRAVCGRRLSSPHDVADAVQETFLRAFDRLDQVRDASALSGWLHAIAARVCVDQLRGEGRTTPLAEGHLERSGDAPDPQDLALAADEASRLHATLATLGARDRRALWLRDAIGLPVATVAAELGVTEGSARVLLTRARTRVRAAYHGLAGVLGLGWLRLRTRVAATAGEPTGIRALAAAQVAVAVAVAVVAVPEVTAPAEGPAPDVTVVAPSAERAGDRPTGGSEAATTGAVASTTVREAVRAASGPTAVPPSRPPIVEFSDEPPAGPSPLGVGASDGDGEVVGVEVWGVVAPSRDDAETEGGSDDDDVVDVGPLELEPGALSSALPDLVVGR